MNNQDTSCASHESDKTPNFHIEYSPFHWELLSPRASQRVNVPPFNYIQVIIAAGGSHILMARRPRANGKLKTLDELLEILDKYAT